ncbi:MAG: glycosyltransferase, partial [Verrucomicrobiales bacterium]
ERPDVIYVATESPLGVSAVKAARKLGIPVVMGFHTNFDQYLGRYKLGGLEATAVAYLKKLHNKAARTLVPSEDVAGRLREQGFENVDLLGRGVDTELFQPEKRDAGLRTEWGAGEGDPVVCIVGRVAPEKNLNLAMRAFAKMRKKNPGTRCVVVGDGPLREKLAREHPEVIFAGMRTGEDLARHYASADVLLFPSETETFGNVLLEGMASGLVTLSYDYAASARYIESGHNGFHVEPGDEEAYITAAVQALGHWENRGPGGVRLRARLAAEELGWDQVVESFEKHLEEVIPQAKELAGAARKPPVSGGKYLVRSLILSDVHLGTKDSKADEAADLIKAVKCEHLILNGDIIDGWALQRGSRWLKQHTRFVRTVLKKLEKDETRVTYLRGNHDEVLERVLPMALGSMEIVKEHIHEALNGKKYLVVHGDGFDSVSTSHPWMAKVGAVCYDHLLNFNRLYNRYRAWRGKEYYSLSKAIKARVKATVSFVDEYQKQLQNLASHRKCDGIICGHIHTPADEQMEDIHYLNSGDWVESLTAIVEHLDGTFEIISYNDFLAWQQESEEKADWVKEKELKVV